jgi:cystathionine beta-synthase
MAGLIQLADRFRAGETVVVIFHDHGTRYLGKMFNDEWMREKGFLEPTGMTARDLVAGKKAAPLVSIECAETVARAAHVMTEHGFSQIPVTSEGRVVGSINEAQLYTEIVKNPEVKRGPVEAIMQPAFPFADVSTDLESLAAMLTPENPAVLVRDFKSDETYIITRSDVIQALS